MANNPGEPSSAPKPDKWYPLRLGSSFRESSSSKFCTLRYEFKPASIDKNQPGLLNKNKDNRVTLEFQNNQPGKPKVTFEGSSEDYKENDGALFFDGETFRLERLHRAVKRLRHVRLPGESAAAAANLASTSSAGAATESRSPPLGKVAKTQASSKTTFHSVPLEVERIDIGEPESPGPRANNKSTGLQSAPANTVAVSPGLKSYEPDDEEDLDILGDDDNGIINAIDVAQTAASALDINIPHYNDNDDEIADIDRIDDGNEGPNAAETPHAQENGEGKQQETSSSSGTSGSGSSGSGSGSGSGSDSSSSDSDGSDNDSASSGGDIDVC